MATLAGTDLFRKQTSTNAAALPNGQLLTGETVEFFATYTVTGSEASGDVIPLVQLPIGAILRPSTLRISTDAVGGTSVTFTKIGDAGDDDRYSATTVPLTAAQTETAVTPTNAIAVTPFVVDTEANRTLLATLGGTLPMTAQKKIVIRGHYRMP